MDEFICLLLRWQRPGLCRKRMKYIEDGRSLVERNHDAREYCYQCRREREARMNRIVRRCLVVSSMIFMCSLLAGFMF